MQPTIVHALTSLGIIDGYAANDRDGIVLWQLDQPQPSESTLIAAGWIKLEPAEEAPEE